MNKLREKFYKKLGIDCLTEQCEQITDDFSVKFCRWENENRQKYNSLTTTELLQIFKTQYYEKQ